MNKIKCIEVSYADGNVNYKYYNDILKLYGELLTDDFIIVNSPMLTIGQYVIHYKNGEKELKEE